MRVNGAASIAIVMAGRIMNYSSKTQQLYRIVGWLLGAFSIQLYRVLEIGAFK